MSNKSVYERIEIMIQRSVEYRCVEENLLIEIASYLYPPLLEHAVCLQEILFIVVWGVFGQCINYVHLVKPHPLVAWKQVNHLTCEKHPGRWRTVFYNLLPPRESSLPSVQNISKMVTRSYGTTRLYARESRDIFSLVSSRYHNLFHWIQEKELVSGNKLEWAKRQLYSLSLSLS